MTSDLALPPGLTMRAATPDDAVMLAALGERTFRDAFGASNTAEDMDAYVAGTYSEAAQRRELSDPAWHTILVEHEGQPVAYAQLREGPAPACVAGPAPIELLRFYVDRAWHGRGTAHALMDEVAATARRLGARTLYLCVWEHNPRAIAFYSKHGYRAVGEKDFVLGSSVQHDHVMARAI